MTPAEPTLSDIIREKQRQLREAEALVGRLRAELHDAGIALIGPRSPAPSKNLTSSTDMAEAVLRSHGRPLHVTDIIAAIGTEFHESVRYATLVGNISRLVKKGKTFERTGRNVFGLLDWAVTREADELFGREEAEREEQLLAPDE